MAWVLAALLLLCVQQVGFVRSWMAEPRIASATLREDARRGDGEPLRIEALLGAATSTIDKVRLAGRVVDASPTFGRGVRLTVELESLDDAPATGRISVSLRETKRRWRTGDRLALSSKIRRIVGFGNFGELDWATYNARRGILATAYAWEDEDVEVLPPSDGLVDRLRRRFSEECEKVGGQGAEILEALTIGDRTGISRETDVAVRDAGLAHYLAISGSHMALVVALMVGLVRLVAGRSHYLLLHFDILRGAAVLGGVAVVAYGFVSGGGVSVARSVLMAVAAMVALWRGRPGDDLRALGGSAILLALVMPGVGEEAGFQLSYLAVAALILDSRRRRWSRAAAPPSHAAAPPTRARKALHLIIEAARLTLLCWAVTSPIVAHHFQRVSLVAPLANMLAGPLVSAVVVCGLAALVVLPASTTAASTLVALGAALSGVVVRIAAWCASLPHAATATAAPGPVLALSLTGLAFVALLPSGRWRRRAVVILVVIATLAFGNGLFARYRGDRLDVWFASVGQGDAAIARLPGGRVLVIDTGPPGRGRMVVGPLLRRAWIGRVDVLVLSHLQSDHMGAAAEVLEDFEVGELWLPDGPCEGNAAEALFDAAKKAGVPVRFVSNEGATAGAPVRPVSEPSATTGAAVRLASTKATSTQGDEAASIEVLWPPPGAARCNENNQSLVLALGYAGRRLLFTGDIEAPAEASLVAAGVATAADVLKVPHHGSRTSSTRQLLQAVKPSLAIASLGLDNHFHFPAAEVASRYAEFGIRLLRTDRHGAVHVTVDDAGLIGVESFLEGSGTHGS